MNIHQPQDHNPSSIESIARLFLIQASVSGEEASLPPEREVQNFGSGLEFASFGQVTSSFPLSVLGLGGTTELREWFLTQAGIDRNLPDRLEGTFNFDRFRVNVTIETREDGDWLMIEPTVRPTQEHNLDEG